jgi:hypothetical protein
MLILCGVEQAFVPNLLMLMTFTHSSATTCFEDDILKAMLSKTVSRMVAYSNLILQGLDY